MISRDSQDMSLDCPTAALPITLPTQRVGSTVDIPIYGEQGTVITTYTLLPGEQLPPYIEGYEADPTGEIWESTYILGRDQGGAWRYTFAEAFA